MKNTWLTDYLTLDRHPSFLTRCLASKLKMAAPIQYSDPKYDWWVNPLSPIKNPMKVITDMFDLEHHLLYYHKIQNS